MREFSGFPPLQTLTFKKTQSSVNFQQSVSCGIENFLLFPECENHYEIFEALRGFQMTLVTNAKSSQETLLLLSGYQIPFLSQE
jgi:ribosomal protein L5